MNSRQLEKAREIKVLILGAYGLVGAGIATHLSAQGFKVIGLGRDRQTANRVLPLINWIIGDLRDYCRCDDWVIILKDVSFVVNCSGALQDGPDDELEMLHVTMMAALAKACQERDIQIIQISAVGANTDGGTRFLSTKALGDNAIRQSGVHFTILRPGLIISPHSYGGLALLRMLAAMPLIQLVSFPKARIQTVALNDVCQAVQLAINGKIPDRFECDLVELQVHHLPYVIGKLRDWLGFKSAIFSFTVPNIAAHFISKCADILSWLGWKSPMRTTGIRVLRAGVEGDQAQWSSLNLFELSSLDQTLGKMRATREDRLSARLSLLFPFLIGILSLFWILSGMLALYSLEEASEVLERVGWSRQTATLSVVFWAIVDIALGVALLFRKLARAACLGMVITSIVYLTASSIFVPELWLDPLGPLIKIIPAIFLALVTRVALENR